MPHALWVDIREPGGSNRRLLFDAEPPPTKRVREALLGELIGRIWPHARAIGYSGGVGTFEVGSATAVAHFGPVRGGVGLLPVEEASSAFLGDDYEAHVTSSAPDSRGVELQLRSSVAVVRSEARWAVARRDEASWNLEGIGLALGSLN